MCYWRKRRPPNCIQSAAIWAPLQSSSFFSCFLFILQISAGRQGDRVLKQNFYIEIAGGQRARLPTGHCPLATLTWPTRVGLFGSQALFGPHTHAKRERKLSSSASTMGYPVLTALVFKKSCIPKGRLPKLSFLVSLY